MTESHLCELMTKHLLASPPSDDSAKASLVAHIRTCAQCSNTDEGRAFLAEFQLNP